jgi:hypothetical protein
VTLSDRSLGWLRHLDRTLRRGGPTPADPAAIAIALGLLGRRTPAWTEPHLALLDLLIDRHPAEAGVDAGAGLDPVLADAAVLLGVRSMLDGATVVTLPRPDPDAVPWSHTELVLHLADGVRAATGTGATPAGDGPDPAEPVVTAGLGLLLHDSRHGTDLHQRVFLPWWERHGRARLGLDGDGPRPGPAALAVAARLAPQVPDDARRLFDAVVPDAAAAAALPADPAICGAALLLAREWGLGELAAAVAATVEAGLGPVGDPDRAEFHWDLDGRGAPGPGADAALAAGEAAGPGLWGALVSRPLTPFGRIAGVEFPELALRQADWVRDCLVLRLHAVHDEPARTTSFRLVDTEPRIWCMTGIDRVTTEITGHGVIIRVPMATAGLEFTPGSY